jgi:iron complex outermembrane receptor protein
MMRERLRLIAIPLLADAGAAVAADEVPAGDAQNATLNLMSYARLRGLSPNDTLVLIDGKRRHGTADLVVDRGPFQGAAGADLSLIPLAAIDHVEVLTDGAAAQYGTDAIAGVINIILKHNSQGGLLTATGGQYFDHQGNTADASVNFGLAPIPNSFLSVTAEVKVHGHSDLIGPDPSIINHDGYDNLALFPNVVKYPGYPDVQGGDGDPLYRMVLLTYNSGFPGGTSRPMTALELTSTPISHPMGSTGVTTTAG